MATELSSGSVWNKAGLSGLVLALVTVALAVLMELSSRAGALGGILRIAVNIVKIVCCIYLFRRFILRFRDETGASAKELYRYGLRIAICSSLLVAGYYLYSATQISPEDYAATVESVLSAYPESVAAQAESQIETMLPKIPAITFFAMLFYCFVWGMVLSSIYSKKADPSDPFADLGPKESNSEPTDNQQ